MIAAIAYQELIRDDPAIVDKIIAILADHPEPGPFEVAIGRAEGQRRTERIFLEIARWSDDIRRSEYDHPTWHYRLRPVIDPAAPPPAPPSYTASGSAFEALALNISMARNPKAWNAERAIALCWIFHIVGDVHQPLHAGELFSAQFPQGDAAGDKIYLIDPDTHRPVKLHWFWDDAVHRAAEPEAALARAGAFMTKFPRAHFRAQLAEDARHPDAIDVWTAESYALAKSLAYRADGPRSSSAETAVLPSPGYARDATAAAEERATLAGYRLADVLRGMFSPVAGEAAPNAHSEHEARYSPSREN